MHGKSTLVTVVAALAACSAFGSGFGLYEPSAAAHAYGCALVGRGRDGSANFINPATLSDLTNITVTVGFVTEHPRGRVEVDGHETSMDPGLFWLPHAQLAVPLPWNFTFGLGCYAEYGLGTEYNDNWAMNWNSLETTVQGLTVNPNLSYAITKDWSVAAGLRWLYFDFEQFSRPQVVSDGVNYGTFSNHLDGDNGFSDLGWQVGTRYKILENLAVGLVYKSAIDVSVRGTTKTRVQSFDYSSIARLAGTPYYAAAQRQLQQTVSSAAEENTGRAAADLTLPQSLTGGFNWDITEKWHLGGAVSWTQWSELDRLVFDLPNDKIVNLDWEDTWRFTLAPSWDFAENWTFILSYIYDMDATSKHQTSTMLPPADRHILSGGFVWNCWQGLELALSYSCIFMDGGRMRTSDALGRTYDLETCWGFCHAAGFSVTYRF